MESKTQALNELHRNEHGYYKYYDSKSGNGHYKTQYWEHGHKQFRKGMITCDCRGWRFNRKCWHTEDMRGLLIEAQIISTDN